ncbi:MAG: alpha-amylase, partial [Pricia sp.]|nr:alpha-amylase [Pricia sp.]
MKKAIFYHIYPLGLLGAPKTNNFTSAPKDLLVGLYPWLDHIESFGCNALYLGPVFESTSHGYDTVDYFQVDRRLGTNTALRNLVLRAEDQGIKVVLDAVFNHVGRDFWAFKDVQKFGKKSKYKDWFSNIDFTKKSPFG